MLDKIKIFAIELSRISMALTLLISSILKSIDPLGLSLKINEYATHLPFISMTLSDTKLSLLTYFLLIVEFTLGLFLLLGYRSKLTTTINLLFMMFMTSLTAFIYFDDSIKDCGCFGDAIKLTNAETFAKNIFLLVLSIVLLISRKKIRPIFVWDNLFFKRYISIIAFIFVIFLNTRHSPIIDFLPYKIGTNLKEEIAKQNDLIEKESIKNTRYIYEKEGISKSFSIDSLPNDDNWNFVKVEELSISDNELLKYDFHPMSDKTGEDISEILLDKKGYSILIIAKRPSQWSIEEKAYLKAFSSNLEAKSVDHTFIYWDISSDNKYIDRSWQKEMAKTADFAFMDLGALHSIARVYPSIILIKDAQIINKVPYYDFQDLSKMTNFVNDLEKMDTDSLQIYTYSLIGLLLTIYLFIAIFKAIKNIRVTSQIEVKE